MRYQLIKQINENYSTIEQVLTNRGIPIEQINHYLNTTDMDINDPKKLDESKLKLAATILILTIQNNLHTLVIIDSDCDGYTSAAVLMNYLHDLFPYWVENKVSYIMHEGKQHGLSDHIKNITESNQPKLILIPDAGSNDVEECKKLEEMGIKVIILDHHLCDVINPYAIVINNQLCDYPNKELSGVGVVYQFCRYLDKLLQTNYADDYLDLVALGLDADMMSLRSLETKHLIEKGFKNPKNPFFVYMMQKNAYSLKNKLTPISVAFYIAPYVNAICRSGTQEQKILIFESMLKHKAFITLPSTKRGHKLGDTEQLVEQAVRVIANVKSRQTKAQEAGLEYLEGQIENNNMLNHKVLLFLVQPGKIDKNIAGLVANKLMAKYQRPVCILTKTTNYENQDIPPWEENQNKTIVSYQGSARGCDKVGVTDFKSICAATGVTLFQTGHPGAFGLGIAEEDIQIFIEKTDAALVDMNDEAVYYVDYIYKGNEVKADDLLTIAGLEDLWGKDLDEPFLCIEHLKVTADMVTVYQKKDNTLKISLPNGISLIKFKATDEECYKLQNTQGYYEMNIVGRANQNEWMGNISAQLFIQDYEIIDSCNYVF